MHTEGTEVLSLHWSSKREKINNIWTTTMSQNIRIEFEGKTPEKVFMDRISYTVREYTQEVVQCYNCQNFGHTSKWCRSQPVCVFCAGKGHRVKDRKCNTDRAKCHNCKLNHTASYRGCDKYKKEKAALKLKHEGKTTIHYARKIVAEQTKYPDTTRRSHPTTEHTNETTYASTLSQRRSREAPDQHPRQAIPPIEGQRWAAQEYEPQDRRDKGRHHTQTEEEIQPRDNRNHSRETEHTQQAKEETEHIVKETLEATLPNLLGTIFMGFTDILLSIMNQNLNETKKLEVVKHKLLEMFAKFFSSEESEDQHNDDHMSQEEEEEENTHKKDERTSGRPTENTNRQQYNSKWDSTKGRQGWRKKH